MAGSTSLTGLTRKSLQTPYALQTISLRSGGTLTAATGKDRVNMPFAGEVVSVRAVVGTAPTGAALLVDLNKNGTTMFTTQPNRVTVPIAGTVPVAGAVPDVKTFAAGDVLSIDVDQIGSGTAGADLVVSVLVKMYLSA